MRPTFRNLRVAVAVLVCVAAATLTLGAQWLHVPYPGAPRTKDGAINMTGSVPRLNGKPDLSGVWQNDGYGPPGGEGPARRRAAR